MNSSDCHTLEIPDKTSRDHYRLDVSYHSDIQSVHFILQSILQSQNSDLGVAGHLSIVWKAGHAATRGGSSMALSAFCLSLAFLSLPKPNTVFLTY